MNLYQILELDINASKLDIKKNYKKLSLKYHPDKNGDKEKFILINQAYQILINDESRKIYDENNHQEKFKETFSDLLKIINEKYQIMEFINRIFGSWDNFRDNFQDNYLNLFEELKKPNPDFKIIFTSIFKKNQKKEIFDSETESEEYSKQTFKKFYKGKKEKNLLDINIDININLEERYLGKVKEIEYYYLEIKDNIIKKRKRKIIIPLLEDNYYFPKLGDKFDTQIGDLIINIKLNHKFIIENYNIIINQEISLYDFVNGFQLQFFNHHFDINLFNKSFQFIKEKVGLLTDYNKKRGDLIINFNVKLDENNIELLKLI